MSARIRSRVLPGGGGVAPEARPRGRRGGDGGLGRRRRGALVAVLRDEGGVAARFVVGRLADDAFADDAVVAGRFAVFGAADRALDCFVDCFVAGRLVDGFAAVRVGAARRDEVVDAARVLDRWP